MNIEITETDLQHDGVGWSANGCWVIRTTIEVPDSLSDLAIVRRIKRSAGIQGMERDEWCGCDFGPWRDGFVGVYADIVD